MYVIDLLIFLFSVCTRDLMLYQLFCLPPDTKCVQADEITRCVYMRRLNKFVENGYYHILLLDSTQAHTDTIPYLRTNYPILAFPSSLFFSPALLASYSVCKVLRLEASRTFTLHQLYGRPADIVCGNTLSRASKNVAKRSFVA